MIYTIQNGVLTQGEGPGEQVGLFALKEMEGVLGPQVCAEAMGTRYTKLEVHPGGGCLVLNVPSTWQQELVLHRVVIFIGKEQLFFFSDDAPLIREAVAERLADGGKTCWELLLRDYLDRLAARDSLYLDRLEQDILDLENDLLTGGKSEYVEPIVTRRSFQSLGAKLDRIYHTILNLRDYVTQVRESYQAQEDIRLNRVMKYFTVISTIFLPLTLIVGWYGMNVRMPEYQWKWGYLWVVLLCVAAVAGCIAFFRKNKWF